MDSIKFDTIDWKKEWEDWADSFHSLPHHIKKLPFSDNALFSGSLVSGYHIGQMLAKLPKSVNELSLDRNIGAHSEYLNSRNSAGDSTISEEVVEMIGTRFFVAIYDDKLEIQNPGIMPPGMSIDQFKAGVSRIRNPVIARVFGELDLVEEWGSGYRRIKDACQKGGYPEPIWEEYGTVLRVTFYPHVDLATQPDVLAPS